MDHVCYPFAGCDWMRFYNSADLPPQFPLRDHYDVVQFRHA